MVSYCVDAGLFNRWGWINSRKLDLNHLFQLFFQCRSRDFVSRIRINFRTAVQANLLAWNCVKIRSKLDQNLPWPCWNIPKLATPKRGVSLSGK